MTFIQEAFELGNHFTSDRVLQSYLRRWLPSEVLEEIRPQLERVGADAGGRLWDLSMSARNEEPELIHFDPWGRRIDEIRVPAAWKEYARVAAEEGLVATAYDGAHGGHSRIHQFALAYLLDRSTHTYSCPLAMTDGAARTLLHHGHEGLIAEAVGHLTSRDPDAMWTAGQWMTERTGGSDVGLSETVARKDGDSWRLHGTKWFTSATTSEMALTLARPEGNPAGGRGLALFHVQVRDEEGALNGITIHRLKEKLGTKMLPTAELTLDGALATPVAGLDNGIRNITPLLNITRTWNAVCSVGSMRMGVALARDFASRRVAFGAPLSEKALHQDTLGGMQAEFEGAFHLAFEVVRLLGREEHGEISDPERGTLRLLFPLAKLLTARQAVAGASEALEAFGGAGYVEDTGLPRLLRDTQVLSIWEGTTNVLSLDSLRAIARDGALEPFLAHLQGCLEGVSHERLGGCTADALGAASAAAQWLKSAGAESQEAMEAGARRFALTLGRAMSLALLTAHAQWALDTEGDDLPMLAAERYASAGVDLLHSAGHDGAARRRLAMDQ
jgi:alkylation response protein AidB-like acyl-CoA dehydrogenase